MEPVCDVPADVRKAGDTIYHLQGHRGAGRP